MRPTEDTVRATPNRSQSNEPAKGSGFAKKVAVSVAAGGAVVGGAALAGTMIDDDNTGENNVQQPEVHTQPEAKHDEPKHDEPKHDEPKQQTANHTADKQTEAGNHHTAENHGHLNGGGSNQNIPAGNNSNLDPVHHNGGSGNNAYFASHDVEVTEIETITSEDGSVVHMAAGLENGHQAVYVDDGKGNLVMSVVDANDNNEIDEGEVHDLRDSGMKMGDLANHMQEAPTPVYQASNDNHDVDVHVVDVARDVDIDGDTVDVAVVEVDKENVMLIDVSQNNEVDLMVADTNHNNQIDEDEIHDVTDHHIQMPDESDIDVSHHDVNTYEAHHDLPDYGSNDDITTYEI